MIAVMSVQIHAQRLPREMCTPPAIDWIVEYTAKPRPMRLSGWK